MKKLNKQQRQLKRLADRIDRLDTPRPNNRRREPFWNSKKDLYINGFYYAALLAQEEIWKLIRRMK